MKSRPEIKKLQPPPDFEIHSEGKTFRAYHLRLGQNEHTEPGRQALEEQDADT